LFPFLQFLPTQLMMSMVLKSLFTSFFFFFPCSLLLFVYITLRLSWRPGLHLKFPGGRKLSMAFSAKWSDTSCCLLKKMVLMTPSPLLGCRMQGKGAALYQASVQRNWASHLPGNSESLKLVPMLSSPIVVGLCSPPIPPTSQTQHGLQLK
jgi:hypothetical protein